MKRIMHVMVCAVLFLGIAAVCDAERGDWRGGIRERIHHAKERINRGAERGSLTHHEVRRLRGEFDGILHRIDRMKSDGHLSHKEREKISRDLDRLDRDISREKRDDDRRGDRGGYSDHRNRR
jgi:hypothetical protein